MKRELKRIGIFSSVKTLFVLGGVAGFIIGLLEWFFLAGLSDMSRQLQTDLYGLPDEALSELVDAGISSLGFLLPFISGFAGAMGGVFFGAILAGTYNVIARLWGGLELEWADMATETAPGYLPRPTVPGAATPLPRVDMPEPVAPAPTHTPERRPPPIYE